MCGRSTRLGKSYPMIGMVENIVVQAVGGKNVAADVGLAERPIDTQTVAPLSALTAQKRQFEEDEDGVLVSSLAL